MWTAKVLDGDDLLASGPDGGDGRVDGVLAPDGESGVGMLDVMVLV